VGIVTRSRHGFARFTFKKAYEYLPLSSIIIPEFKRLLTSPWSVEKETSLVATIDFCAWKY